MSNKTIETPDNASKITKQDLTKVFWRNLFGLQWGWNYEKMQGLGYCYVMLPILKKLYANHPEKLIQSMKAHLGYFNTTPAMAHLIVGANIALEEEVGIDQAEDAIVGLKTGLMGPFAGVGDTIFVALYRSIVFAIAAYMALEGVALGLIIPIICGVVVFWVRYRFTMMGYEQGRKLAANVSGSLKMITEAASILGLTVIGALVPSVVKATLPLQFVIGDLVFPVQEKVLDKIMPGLLPLAVVLFSYWILGKKKMTSTKLILILIALGMVLGNIGVFTAWLGSFLA